MPSLGSEKILAHDEFTSCKLMSSRGGKKLISSERDDCSCVEKMSSSDMVVLFFLVIEFLEFKFRVASYSFSQVKVLHSKINREMRLLLLFLHLLSVLIEWCIDCTTRNPNSSC